MNINPWQKISGTVGSFSKRDLIIEGNILEVKKFLTARDESAAQEISLCTTELKKIQIQIQARKTARLPPGALAFKERGLQARIYEAKSRLIREYYAEENGKIYTSHGFWFICEKIEMPKPITLAIPELPYSPRPYQEESALEALKYPCATIELATGLGKTLVISLLVNSLLEANHRVLVVVPNTTLLWQNKQALNKFISKVGVQGDKKKMEPGDKVVVTTIQSSAEIADRFDAIIVDECLVGNTKIKTNLGTMTIKEIHTFVQSKKKLQVVSYCEDLKKFEHQDVLNSWEKPRQTTVEISIDGLTIKSSENHKFLTTDGWKEAKDIALGDLLVGKQPFESKVEHLVVSGIEKTTKKQPLYDIEVSKNHNFLVTNKEGRGVIVHNCHHSGAQTYIDLAINATSAKKIYGLTATPYRTDQLDKGIQFCTGPVIYQKDTKWGIQNNYLSPVRIAMLGVSGTYAPLGIPYQKEYSIRITHSKITETVRKLILSGIAGSRKSILVLYKTINPGRDLIEKTGLDCLFACSSFKAQMKKFSTEGGVLVSNSALLGEGVDIPNIDMVISLVCPRSESLVRQILGRGLRLTPNAADLAYIDVYPDDSGKFSKGAEIRKNIYLSVADTVKTKVV